MLIEKLNHGIERVTFFYDFLWEKCAYFVITNCSFDLKYTKRFDAFITIFLVVKVHSALKNFLQLQDQF